MRNIIISFRSKFIYIIYIYIISIYRYIYLYYIVKNRLLIIILINFNFFLNSDQIQLDVGLKNHLEITGNNLYLTTHYKNNIYIYTKFTSHFMYDYIIILFT